MLEESQASLNDDVLENGSWRDIDGAAFSSDNDDCAFQSDTTTQVDGSSDSQMVQFKDLGNAWDALEEVRNLLEIIS